MSFNEWKEVKIDEIGTVITGKTPSSKTQDHFGDNIPFVTPTDFKNYHKKIFGAERYLSQKGKEGLGCKVLPINSVIVTCIGSDMGKVVINSVECVTNQQINSIITNEGIVDANYLYYKIFSISEHLKQLARGGTTMPIVNKGTFEQIGISLPPLEEQKAIAATLSCLDEKIELNNKINKTLEEIAQAIFKSWFVDFEPFQDGEFEDSELGRIPKGWRVGTLDEITCKFATGLNPRKNFILGQGENYYVTIKNMANNNVILDSRCDRVTNEAILKINKRSDLKKGDLLFSGIGTIGRVYLIDRTPENWNISESVFTIRPNSLYTSELLYLLLLSEKMQDYAQSSASGSVQKGIRMADLKKFKVLIPPIDIVHKVSDILRTIIDNTKINHHQNGNLIRTRDTLLPKLMSGEIRVPIEEVQVNV